MSDRSVDASPGSWVKTFCRICQANCGMEVRLDNGAIAAVRGDRTDPMSQGYACFKGLKATEQHNSPQRIRTTLKRDSEGGLRAVPIEDALDDVAARLSVIIAEHGPDAVALYMGTQSSFTTIDQPYITGFADALPTKRIYGTVTIDQSAKWIAERRAGSWKGGVQSFDSSDVWLMIGSNPLVSMVYSAGHKWVSFTNPIKRLKRARARGMKLIVIDPRRSETAQFADLFIQPQPGEDAALLASILHVILRESWHDQAFCTRYVDGMEELRQALAPFCPRKTANRTGVAEENVVAVAAMFARDSASGMAGSGTGIGMGPHSNVAEHLIHCLNIVCGRFPRAGDNVHSPSVLMPTPEPVEGVSPPFREWETGPMSDVHGTGRIYGQMMTATLVDDILLAGSNRIRALICVGGNPGAAFPDQALTRQALSKLDLLVAIEPRRTATTEHAHYIFAPKLQFERHDHTGFLEAGGMFPVPYAHYTAPLVRPGANLVDDWEVIWGISRRLGISVRLGSGTVPIERKPTTVELLEMLAAGGPVAVDRLRGVEGGRLFPREVQVKPGVVPSGRFMLSAPDIREELAAVSNDMHSLRGSGKRFRLTVRRHRELMNTLGADFQATQKRFGGNPAYMHPADIDELGLKDGELVIILGDIGKMSARVRSDSNLRRGVVSITHCWAGTGDDPYASTSVFVDARNHNQTINHMVVMTAIPVDVIPAV